jgi:hypothetical protein
MVGNLVARVPVIAAPKRVICVAATRPNSRSCMPKVAR